MTDARDPLALVRHSVAVGDWRLVELIARLLTGDRIGSALATQRACSTLVVGLGLRDCGD
jgi:hypothetical protein